MRENGHFTTRYLGIFRPFFNAPRVISQRARAVTPCLNFVRSFCNVPWFYLSVPPVSGVLGLLVSWFLGFWVSWFLGFLVSPFLGLLVSVFFCFWVSWFIGFLVSRFLSFGVSCLGFKCDPVGFRSVCVSCFVSGGSWLRLLRSLVSM